MLYNCFYLFWLLSNTVSAHKKISFQGKVFSDSEPMQARAEAVMLLKQLDFPVSTVTSILLIDVIH